MITERDDRGGRSAGAAPSPASAAQPEHGKADAASVRRGFSRRAGAAPHPAPAGLDRRRGDAAHLADDVDVDLPGAAIDLVDDRARAGWARPSGSAAARRARFASRAPRGRSRAARRRPRRRLSRGSCRRDRSASPRSARARRDRSRRSPCAEPTWTQSRSPRPRAAIRDGAADEGLAGGRARQQRPRHAHGSPRLRRSRAPRGSRSSASSTRSATQSSASSRSAPRLPARK